MSHKQLSDFMMVFLICLLAVGLVVVMMGQGCNNKTSTTKIYENIGVDDKGMLIIVDGSNTVSVTQQEWNELAAEGGVLI